jgi:hypothetical protein
MSLARELYNLYPKHLAPKEAIRAIEKALKRLPGELEGKIANETEWLKERVALFAGSDAGRTDGLFPGYKPPYPATWFNKTRYLDDATEWFTNGKSQRDIEKPAESKRTLYEQADPECETCAGIGYATSKTRPGTLEACSCTLAERSNRQLGADDSLGTSRAAQARFEGFEEVPSRALGAAANGTGKRAV